MKKIDDKSLVRLGFLLKDGEIKDFNGNIYATQVMENYELLYSRDSTFYYYLNGVFIQISDTELKNILMKDFDADAPDLWKPSYERFYMESLKHKVFYEGQMNENKNFINLKNGMLELSTMELKEHSKKYYSTVQLPFAYDPNATCEQFQKYLDSVFEGDEERIALLQEWFGYLLTCETKAQKALVLYGSGSNGKGVCSSIIEALVGRKNISYASLADLSNQFIRATLFDKQLVMSSENEIGTLNTQYFKQIVGGDTCITASHKNKKPFEFFPYCKIVMSTNNLPDTRDRTDGFYRRLQFIHFSKYFSEEEKDVNLTEKLKTELPGILNWALVGLQRLRENDYSFSPCESSDQLLQEYRVEQNPFLEFVSECLNVDTPQSKEENRIIYNSFKNWCHQNGHHRFADISSKKFWREFDNAIILSGHEPPERKNSGNHRYCYGITVKKDYRWVNYY